MNDTDPRQRDPQAIERWQRETYPFATVATSR